MSRFPRLRRRPDHWANAHERARVRAAERLDGPLGLAESTWLDEHLAGCPSCAAIAAAYEADRASLRGLRDDQPEPPRDLWARTAAVIEQLSTDAAPAGSSSAGPASSRLPAPAGGRLGGLPLAAMSAVAVVVVVVGATLLSNGFTNLGSGGGSNQALGEASSAAGSPSAVGGTEATPFAVEPGDVAWVDAGQGGDLAYSNVRIEKVCPAGGASGCPEVRDGAAEKLALTASPRTIIGSPSKKQAVAIAKGATAGDELLIVDLPQAAATASPSPTPVETKQPSPSAPASAAPSGSAPANEAPSVEASPSVVVETSPSVPPLGTPEPTTANRLAIASGIAVVGESAAFSPDGSWFAFTARPADGTGGPDVYVWRVGDERAKRLTDDGTTYFASWSEDQAVVSRPTEPDLQTTDPASFVVDPETNRESPLFAMWRPVVDPTGRFAIVWDGTLDRAADRHGWAPGRGSLVLRPWPDGDGAGGSEHRVAADAARGDFDVRWDETGEWVAVWVADQPDDAVGRLTLFHLDAKRGRLETAKGAPEGVQALSGFSIESGRLAWATPRGQGGEGSRVQIAAWSESGIGIVESSPGEDVRIIR